MNAIDILIAISLTSSIPLTWLYCKVWYDTKTKCGGKVPLGIYLSYQRRGLCLPDYRIPYCEECFQKLIEENLEVQCSSCGKMVPTERALSTDPLMAQYQLQLIKEGIFELLACKDCKETKGLRHYPCGEA